MENPVILHYCGSVREDKTVLRTPIKQKTQQTAQTDHIEGKRNHSEYYLWLKPFNLYFPIFYLLSKLLSNCFLRLHNLKQMKILLHESLMLVDQVSVTVTHTNTNTHTHGLYCSLSNEFHISVCSFSSHQSNRVFLVNKAVCFKSVIPHILTPLMKPWQPPLQTEHISQRLLTLYRLIQLLIAMSAHFTDVCLYLACDMAATHSSQSFTSSVRNSSAFWFSWVKLTVK